MAKNILILSNNIGGLYSFRKEVIKAIAQEGYQVYISIPDVDSSRVEYFEKSGCHIIPTIFNRRGTNPLADLKLVMTYCRLIKRLKPVAVLTYTIKPNVYGGIACRLSGTPQLANVTGLGDAVENGGWLQKMTVILYKIGIGKAKRVFFQNQSNKDFCIRHGIADEQSILLPGSGVNLQHHVLRPYPEDGAIRFLYIGRIMRDKGSEELFKAAKEIKKKYDNVEFQILGSVEGDYHNQLEELVSQGIIKFLGQANDVRPYIGKAHCTIMPSYHEGMSNVNLESAANGRPVITTDVPGCRETVDDGVSGILVKVKDIKSLIDGVEKFLSLTYEQKKRMGIEGRKKVEREFDRQIVVNVYIKALNEIKQDLETSLLS